MADSGCYSVFMRLDLSKPQFTQAAACKITGLTRASIQTRINRGQVKVAQQHPGRQAKRLFSALDLIKLSFIEQMSRHHFASGVAAEVADEVAAHARRWWNRHPETTEPIFDPETGQALGDLPGIKLKAWKEGWEESWHMAIFTNADGATEVHPFQLSDKEYWMNELNEFPDVYTVIQIDVLISKIINAVLRFVHEEPRK